MFSASVINDALSRHGFLINATYKGATIKANFRDRFVESMEVSGTIPFLTCLDADIVGIERGHQVIVNNIAYKVAEIYSQSNGWTDLKLERQ